MRRAGLGLGQCAILFRKHRKKAAYQKPGRLGFSGTCRGASFLVYMKKTRVKKNEMDLYLKGERQC